MKWWTEPPSASELKQPVAVTIGNFDGVHLGHQELLKKAVAWADLRGGTSLLLTFYPHPVQVLYPERKHVRLFDQEDQKEQLEKRRLTAVMLQSFSRQFSELSAPDFLERYILKNFHPEFLVVGHDFSFGAHRQGQHELLKAFCDRHRIQLEVVPPLQVSGKTVSTSQIREALLTGDLNLAKQMLGRSYYLKGIVEKGEGRGRQLGFPTANIRPVVDFFPKTGVYVTRAICGDQQWPAVTNIGMNKTFVEGEAHPIKVETYLLERGQDLYGRTLKIELLEYLREEKKFSSLEELKTQIATDVNQAKGFFHVK